MDMEFSSQAKEGGKWQMLRNQIISNEEHIT
jgi:hypothetical protein